MELETDDPDVNWLGFAVGVLLAPVQAVLATLRAPDAQEHGQAGRSACSATRRSSRRSGGTTIRSFGGYSRVVFAHGVLIFVVERHCLTGWMA